MLADTCGDLAKALDLQLDLAAVLGNMRCKRFSMLVEDGTVAKVNIEPDGKNINLFINWIVVRELSKLLNCFLQALVSPAAWQTRLFNFSLYCTAVYPKLSGSPKVYYSSKHTLHYRQQPSQGSTLIWLYVDISSSIKQTSICAYLLTLTIALNLQALVSPGE